MVPRRFWCGSGGGGACCPRCRPRRRTRAGATSRISSSRARLHHALNSNVVVCHLLAFMMKNMMKCNYQAEEISEVLENFLIKNRYQMLPAGPNEHAFNP